MDVTAEQPALAGLAPRRARARGPEPVAAALPVAQVLVDRPQPHLDRAFDYAVPASMTDRVRPGVRVRVRFAGQDVDGFCVARCPRSDHDLVPLRRVVSDEVVLTPEVLALARAVADRWAGTVADVLRLAVPPRHARVEGERWDGADVAEVAEHDTSHPSWEPYAGAGAFLRRIGVGEAPRAVWQAVPGAAGRAWSDGVAAAVRVAAAAGRGAVVVVPTATEVAAVTAALEATGVPPWTPGRRGGWVRLVAEDGPAPRYRAFLAAARGHARVVVGTRAAAFAPVHELGLVVCWDDASDLLVEPRAPYPHARDVLALRSEREGAALLVGGFARSVAAHRWVETGWAHPLVAPRDAVRARTPRVVALTSAELAREGPAAAARLPGAAWRAARDGLAAGPVLVQVPRAGYLPAVACRSCRELARCPACAGPLQIPRGDGVAACRWCARLAGDWRCGECGGTGLRAVRVGSERTAEELGRAFPGIPVRVSGAGPGVLDAVPDAPALVVATPGAEPMAPSGYAAALLLDAAVVTARPALEVAEKALRSWLRAASLVRPASAGGTVLLVGDAAPVPSQALVRWDPAWLAERELAERRELRLPPAVHTAVVEGPRDAVEALLARLAVPSGGDVLGPAPLDRSEGGDSTRETTLLEPDWVAPVRAIVRAPWADGATIARELRGLVASRAARREPGTVRVRMEQTEVW